MHSSQAGSDIVVDRSAEEFDALAARTGAVLHLAAKVDLNAGFDAHCAANVDGVVEVLRLAFRARARLIFASTTDVLPSGWGDDEPAPSSLPTLSEKDGCKIAMLSRFAVLPVSLTRKHHYFIADALSKLVGERLVETAVDRGLAANIVRLGFIGGSSETGACNPKDFICRLLIGLCHTRAFPEPSGPDAQTLTRFLPVDVASRALSALVSLDGHDDPSASGVVHLTSGGPELPLSELHTILQRFGAPFSPLPLVPFTQWMERAELDGALSVWPVLSWAKGRPHFPVFNTRSARPRRALELLDLAGDSALCAELSPGGAEQERVIHAMLRHLFG